MCFHSHFEPEDAGSCNTVKITGCNSLENHIEAVDGSDPDEIIIELNTGCADGNPGPKLENAPATCSPKCFRFTKPGKYCYMSTRNNNFSNRRHMGEINVK